MNCDLTLSLIEGFESKNYDIIVIKQEPGRLYKNAIPLWRERLVWVTAHSPGNARKFKEHCKSFESLPLVLAPPPCVYRARAVQALDRAAIIWKNSYTSPSVAGTLAAVKAGLGYTVLPRKMVPGDLVALEQEQGWPKLKDSEICLLIRPEASKAADALGEYIKTRISFNQKN